MRISIVAILGIFLLGPGVRAEEVYVDNVVIVLDASGSMGDKMSGTGTEKISAAKSAIKEVMKTIPQTTQMGLLVFGGQAGDWVYPLGIRDDAKLFQAIERVTAGGGTPLGEYMKKGADRLLEARKTQYGYGSYRLLVVTDGEATDAALVERYTPDIIARGIVADVIGVDMARDHTLATKVHSYRRANDPGALKQAIQEVFAEVGRASDGQSGESAFEELAGFPEEAAMATISALVSSGNHPIGQKPGTGVERSAPQKPTSSAHPQAQSAQQGGAKSKKRDSGFNWIIPIAVVAAVVIFTWKSKRHGR
jgi:uncharacterized protein YegL